ncbi:hypothetical protein COCHEDRAFT_1022907 [Bipolaris maydis C5]|uniref:Uncharacterized protein n=1 Tax=Cochliobolus heterostrophus (strain C5 / ATCC 48332 / race O) TaxID=701091 RepID=M2U479_COCH5|nr:hypothetical protein COCHEDRAFT_1022907 [Bipolaris maydis C5]KAH7556762.1 hypothetical protein BM1_06196 [Bipolaris maydis]KAJ6205507.1 hypothetical protein PSV09DRAFT_1022907 [Bipolaris maydis]KAJ6279085.1 hypothetical protein J3E71DRAFT_311312 [Bipolaris maydis]
MKLLSTTFLAITLLSQFAAAQSTVTVTCTSVGTIEHNMYCAYAQKSTSCTTTCSEEQVKNRAVVSCTGAC